MSNKFVPRAFSSFKMADWRNPWPKLLKYSKIRVVFCHLTHDEKAFSEVVSSVWRPCLFSCNPKPLFKRNEVLQGQRQGPREFLEPFWQPGFSDPPSRTRRRPGGRGSNAQLLCSLFISSMSLIHLSLATLDLS